MPKQNRGKKIEEMLEAAKAPVGHLFNKHDCCGAWYKHKMLTLEHKQKQQQYYHDVEKDTALYKQLTGVVVEFATKECLLESCHPFDTQTNEAMIMLVMEIYKYKFAELCEYCSWCSGVGV